MEELLEADRLLSDPSSNMNSSPAYTWYLLAIACKRLGLDDEADSWYQKANAWVGELEQPGKDGKKKPAVAWNRRITLDVLEREAALALASDESFDKADPQVWLGRVAAHRHRGDHDALKTALQQGIEHAGDQALPWVERAKWHTKAGRTAEAKADYIEAFQRNLNDVDIASSIPFLETWAKDLRTTGHGTHTLQQIEGIIDDYYAGKTATQPTAQALMERGERLRKRGLTEEAIESFTAAIELEPADRASLKSLAELHVAQQQWEKAIEYYDKLIKLRPSSIQLRTGRALCEFKQNGIATCRARCRESYELFANRELSDSDKRALLAMACMTSGVVEDTRRLNELASEMAAAKLDRPNFSRSTLAWALFRQGQTKEALELLSDRDDLEEVDKIHFLLAMLHHAAGDIDLAKKYLENSDAWLAQWPAEDKQSHWVAFVGSEINQQEAHDVLGIPLPVTTQTDGREATNSTRTK